MPFFMLCIGGKIDNFESTESFNDTKLFGKYKIMNEYLARK